MRDCQAEHSTQNHAQLTGGPATRPARVTTVATTMFDVREQAVEEGHVRLANLNLPDRGDDDVVDLRVVGRECLWGQGPLLAYLPVVAPVLEPLAREGLHSGAAGDARDTWVGPTSERGLESTCSRAFGPG